MSSLSSSFEHARGTRRRHRGANATANRVAADPRYGAHRESDREGPRRGNRAAGYQRRNRHRHRCSWPRGAHSTAPAFPAITASTATACAFDAPPTTAGTVGNRSPSTGRRTTDSRPCLFGILPWYYLKLCGAGGATYPWKCPTSPTLHASFIQSTSVACLLASKASKVVLEENLQRNFEKTHNKACTRYKHRQ